MHDSIPELFHKVLQIRYGLRNLQYLMDSLVRLGDLAATTSFALGHPKLQVDGPVGQRIPQLVPESALNILALPL